MDPSPINQGRNRNRSTTRRNNDKAIRKYIVVRDNRISDLEKRVMTKVEDGYVPQDGVVFQMHKDGGITIMQAMVKY